MDPQILKTDLIFSPENMFYPVLGIKKTTNLYQKKYIKKKFSLKKQLYKSQHFNSSDEDSKENQIKNYEYIKHVNK